MIAGQKPGTRLVDINRQWNRVEGRGKLGDVRLHDCRHSISTRALALGESLPTIGKLLGHTQVETTARYAHVARDSVHEAAARIDAGIGTHLLGGRTTEGAAGASADRRQLRPPG